MFARLAAEAALGGLEPVTLLALLKHPLLRLGAKQGAHDDAIATLERALLRGPRPRPGSDGLAQALATFRANRDQLHRSDPRWLIADDEFDVAADLIARLGDALAPLERLKAGDHPLAVLANWHRDVVAALSPDAEATTRFAGIDGDGSRAFEELIESPSAAGLAVGKSDYPELFHAIIADRVVRRPEIRDVRVQHLGPLGSAPGQPSTASCSAASTRAPGRRRRATIPGSRARCAARSASIRPNAASASSAHDFAQSAGRARSDSRARRQDRRRPTVTSRFVQRIAALAGEARWEEVLARGNVYLDYARALDHPAQVKSAAAPGAEADSRGAAVAAVGHRHRGLAARSLHHLRPLYSAPAAARRGRYAARRARPRHRHPRRHRRLHQAVRRGSRRPIR